MSSYQIYEFDGVPLPIYDPEQDLSTGTVDSTLLASVGGTFDVWSSYQRTPRMVKHAVGGVYVADDVLLLLVDHAGNQIVDHAGNRIMVATDTQHVRGQVDALRAKVGVRASLWRRRWDDTTVSQWKTARLLAVQEKSDLQHRTVAAQCDCVFESAMANWRDATIDTISGTLVSSGQVGLLLGSDGNATIEDSTINVTASGTISYLQFTIATLGVDLRYAGTIGAGSVLTIDCGAQTVTLNGAAAYSGFSLGGGHSARSWLPLPPGTWAMLVGSNGAGTVQTSHYDQWV
jgi:hypothetical protein